MHPVLFEIPFASVKVHSYGLMVAVGFLAALAWIRYQSRRESLPTNRMLDFAFLMLLTALVGSRIAYALVEWNYFRQHPWDFFRVWEGGLIFYGGLIACIPVAWIFLRRHRLSFWKVSDVFMPGVALGHALGRIGCFLAGCCYGRTCDVNAWYALVFPNKPGSLAPPGVPLYPTQLMESAAEFLIFLVLAAKSRKKAFDGQILLLYLILYAILRYGIEFFRGDKERGFVIAGWLSTSQLLSLFLLIAAVLALLYRRRRSS
jgi:phosphatidylglycerol:prolipoprotein diacylglycerol transferase